MRLRVSPLNLSPLPLRFPASRRRKRERANAAGVGPVLLRPGVPARGASSRNGTGMALRAYLRSWLLRNSGRKSRRRVVHAGTRERPMGYVASHTLQLFENESDTRHGWVCITPQAGLPETWRNARKGRPISIDTHPSDAPTTGTTSASGDRGCEPSQRSSFAARSASGGVSSALPRRHALRHPGRQVVTPRLPETPLDPVVAAVGSRVR